MGVTSIYSGVGGGFYSGLAGSVWQVQAEVIRALP
jgi:hypothetical protein